MMHDPIYPETPGHRWVDTSMEAASAIAPKCGRLQRLALEAIREAGFIGLTADELADRLKVDRYTIQPRTSELRVMGLIADSKQRRRNRTGKRAIVWVAAEGGAMNPYPITSPALDIGNGFSVAFRFDGKTMDVKWRPHMPKGRMGRSLLPAYQLARNMFMLKVALFTGKNVAVVDLPMEGCNV